MASPRAVYACSARQCLQWRMRPNRAASAKVTIDDSHSVMLCEACGLSLNLSFMNMRLIHKYTTARVFETNRWANPGVCAPYDAAVRG